MSGFGNYNNRGGYSLGASGAYGTTYGSYGTQPTTGDTSGYFNGAQLGGGAAALGGYPGAFSGYGAYSASPYGNVSAGALAGYPQFGGSSAYSSGTSLAYATTGQPSYCPTNGTSGGASAGGGVPRDRQQRSVFVGNIPYKASENELIQIFQQAGDVVAFRLVSDRDTGRPKGFGFCEYADASSAVTALEQLNGTELHGRALRVGSSK